MSQFVVATEFFHRIYIFSISLILLQSTIYSLLLYDWHMISRSWDYDFTSRRRILVFNMIMMSFAEFAQALLFEFI